MLITIMTEMANLGIFHNLIELAHHFFYFDTVNELFILVRGHFRHSRLWSVFMTGSVLLLYMVQLFNE